MDIKQQIKKFDEENKPFHMVDHGDGHEWKYVFEKAFEGEENLKERSEPVTSDDTKTIDDTG